MHYRCGVKCGYEAWSVYGAYDFHEANTKSVANLRENLEPVYGAYMF